MASPVEFPSPVGGVPFPADFAPSVVFAVLYSCLIPLLAYRVLDAKSRNTLVVGTAVFVIERIVIFSLRAVQSHNPAKRVSKSLTVYMQITIGMGFIGLAQNLLSLLRVLLVNSTHARSVQANTQLVLADAAMPPTSQLTQTKDNPSLRFRYRRFADLSNVAFVTAIVPGVVGNSQYGSAMSHDDISRRVMRLRYASSAVALVLIIFVACSARWAAGRIPACRKRATTLLTVICGLIAIPAIYRLSVMYRTTTTLISISPSSLNTPAAKATFYVFHMMPEWISVSLLLGLNIREIFDTGMLGDWRIVDETKKEQDGTERREYKVSQTPRSTSKDLVDHTS